MERNVQLEECPIVVIAASAGGLQALRELLSGIPRGFRATIVVAQHLDPRHRSMMAELLARHTALQVKQAEDGDQLQSGHVYIAPPDYHMLVNGERKISLVQTEKIGFLRPRADLLFESVAKCCPDHLVAIVLSGTGRDGAEGVEYVKEAGGTVIAQDKDSAGSFGMPQAAIETGCVDYVVNVKEMAQLLEKLLEGK